VPTGVSGGVDPRWSTTGVGERTVLSGPVVNDGCTFNCSPPAGLDGLTRDRDLELGHNCWVIPEEEPFVTKVIERSCLVGSADEFRTRVADLNAAGLDQIVLLPPLDAKEQVFADAAHVFIGAAPAI
jgi:hypothetical protein